MKSILLIEDNIDILENLAEYLEMEGYRVYSTNNGEKGIELALKFMPDLIICHMPRPGIDGYKVLQALIDNLSITKIPFIFCTTMSEKINRSDALESGADDYITKPFELETILQIAKLCIKTGTKRQKLSA